VPINFDAIVEHRQSIEAASAEAQERKEKALEQIAMLEAKASEEKP
jgi:hypothetical protein